jgi:hypothetical protein
MTGGITALQISKNAFYPFPAVRKAHPLPLALDDELYKKLTIWFHEMPIGVVNFGDRQKIIGSGVYTRHKYVGNPCLDVTGGPSILFESQIHKS